MPYGIAPLDSLHLYIAVVYMCTVEYNTPATHTPTPLDLARAMVHCGGESPNETKKEKMS